MFASKGDLLAGNGSVTPQILAVGGAENFLMADAAATLGLSYQAAARLLGKCANLTAGVTNTTTRTSFGFSVVLPANYLTAGKHVRCRVFGNYVALNTSQSFQLAAWANGIGGVAGDGASFTCALSGRFFLEIEFVCQTAGAAGTVVWGGDFYAETAAGTVPIVVLGNSAAFNTTVANTVDFSCQWTAASASNSAALRGGSVEAF